MLNEDEYQKTRTPQELRDFVCRTMKEVGESQEERERANLKKGLYKEFIDELAPLSDFVNQAYPNSVKIKPVLGNQGFDAIVFDETGAEIEKIEVTSPHDGQWAAADGRARVDRGFGLVEVGIPGNELEPFIESALETCRKKALKDYGDCALVIALAPWPVQRGYEREYEMRLRDFAAELRDIRYKARKVYLLIQPDRLVLIQE